MSQRSPYRNFYVGVDGGATKCIVRLEDEQGTLLGREVGGPASMRFAATDVWQSILSVLNKILQQHALSLNSQDIHFHAGIGIAGSEIKSAYQAFVNSVHPFKTCIVTSDAHTACLGAHGARDGAVIIAGTGVVGYQIQAGKGHQVGGFGFPHDDDGGGAWLGMQAIKKTVQSLDGRGVSSGLTKAVMQRFNNDPAELTAWANQANATSFAEIAPLVIQFSQQQDVIACDLLKRAALAVDELAATLLRTQTPHSSPLPCALVGGVSSFIQPYLSAALQNRLVSVSSPPDAGAVSLVRNQHAV